jgi:uncharacterized protein YoxC
MRELLCMVIIAFFVTITFVGNNLEKASNELNEREKSVQSLS